MTNVLLIWEIVPEATQAYLLGDSKMIDLARKSVGKYINSDQLGEDHPIFLLSNLLDQHCQPLDTSDVIRGPFDEVIVCGMIL